MIGSIKNDKNCHVSFVVRAYISYNRKEGYEDMVPSFLSPTSNPQLYSMWYNITPEIPLRSFVLGASVKMSAFMGLRRIEASLSVKHLRSPGELAEQGDSSFTAEIQTHSTGQGPLYHPQVHVENSPWR